MYDKDYYQNKKELHHHTKIKRKVVHMKISIDTNTDSPHAIRKAMELLGYLANNQSHNQHIKGEKAPRGEINGTSLAQKQTQNLSDGFASMFSDTTSESRSTAPHKKEQTPDTAPNFGSFLSLVNKNEPTTKKDHSIEYF
jgi:hypothetical protein